MAVNRLSLKYNQAEEPMALMMHRYERMLLNFCTRLLRDHDLAQDAVQETFLKAYLKRESFRGEHERSEKAWLMQIAANACKDQQRSKWVRIIDGRIDLESITLPVAQDDEAMMLRWAIGSLPAKYREIIRMYYDQDMTTHEIAFAVRQSPSVVYRRLKKARELLGSLLQ